MQVKVLTKQEVKEKIHKLLALGGNNPSKEEREQAKRKAFLLMRDNEITPAEMLFDKQEVLEYKICFANEAMRLVVERTVMRDLLLAFTNTEAELARATQAMMTLKEILEK